MSTIARLDFQKILPVWRNNLWPERTSPIESISWINHRGEIDLEMRIGQPTFWGYVDNENNVFGVCSGFKTSNTHYRSRGLWVCPTSRRMGIATALMNEVKEQAAAEGCSILWTMPRHAAFNFYQKVGFRLSGQTYAFEYGPHMLAELLLPSSLHNTHELN